MANQLYRELISGNIFVDEETSGRFLFTFASSNPDPAKWEDVSTIEMWQHILDFHGVYDEGYGMVMYLGKDYRFVRDEIKSIICASGVTNTLSTESDPSILSPNTGDTYLVGSSPMKEFSMEMGKVARWNGMSWEFITTCEAGFDILSPSQKVTATIHKIGTHSQRLTALGGNQALLVQIGLQYISNTTNVRMIRLAHAVSAMHNYTEQIKIEINPITFGLEDNSGLATLNTPPVSPITGDTYIVGVMATGSWMGMCKQIAKWDGSVWGFMPRYFINFPELVLGTIDAHNYIYKYKELGLGGLIDDDRALGLFDYLNATVGTMWEFTGMRVLPWTPASLLDMNAFADLLLDILQNGNY